MKSNTDSDLTSPLPDGTTANGSGPRLPPGQPTKRWKRWGKVVGGLVAVVTAGTAVWGVVNTIDLQRDGNDLQRAGQNAHLEEVMMDVDRHFVQYPQLRPFFYDGKGEAYPSRSGKVQSQALATAEMIIDYADDIAAYMRVSKMNRHDHERWSSMLWSYFRESAVMRHQWKQFNGPNDHLYDQFTACVLGAPTGDELKHWKWKKQPKKRFGLERCQDSGVSSHPS